MPEGHSRPPEPVGGHEGTPELPHTIKQHALTGATVHYHCRQCQTALHSKLSEAGEHESCPNCGTGFIVPGAQAKVEEARRAAESEKATREAERMKEAAKRVEQHQKLRNRSRTASAGYTRNALRRPASMFTSFVMYEVLGALILLIGLLLLLFGSGFGMLVGAIGFVGGLLLMALAAVGRVMDYCAGALYEIELHERRRGAHSPPSPKDPQL